MRPARAVAVLLVVLTAGACSKHEYEPEGNREARLQDAEERYAEVVWDTIAWEGEGQRELAGNGVYAARCRNCHGTLGEGATEYGASRGLEVPSLVEPEWEMAGRIDLVRHRVFVGHAGGMPIWGVAGLTEREIDAVAYYVVESLRPEVMGGG